MWYIYIYVCSLFVVSSQSKASKYKYELHDNYIGFGYLLQECIAVFFNFVMTCSMMLFFSHDVAFCYLLCKEMCQFTFCYFTVQYLRFLSFYILKCCILHTVYYILPVNILASHSLTHYRDLLRNRFHFWGVSPCFISNELCHSVLRSLVWTSKSRSMARSLGLWQVLWTLSSAIFEHVTQSLCKFCQMILIKLIEPLKPPLTEEGSLWACSKGKDIDWWNLKGMHLLPRW